MNENYEHPALPEGAEQGILKGMYLLQRVARRKRRAARAAARLAAPSCARSIAAAELLEKDWGVAADVWSATSFTELRRDGLAAERWNLLHPEGKPRSLLRRQDAEERPAGPVIAATDYMKTFADQIRPFIPKDRSYRVLGTDGFGRSDSRAKLRHFFEVNRYFVAVAALKALADEGEVQGARRSPTRSRNTASIPNKADPTTV